MGDAADAGADVIPTLILQERMLGRPFAELLDVMAATWRYLVLELGQSALSLLPAVERRLP